MSLDNFSHGSHSIDKYELARVFEKVQLSKAPPYLDQEQLQTIEQFFCNFVVPEEVFDRNKCTFGKEVVGKDDQGRIFVSGEYTTVLKQNDLPGHNYFYSFALDNDNQGGRWLVDAGHIVEMSFMRSLYFEKKNNNKYDCTIENELGKRQIQVDDIRNSDWVGQFHSLSSA
jgi:hypothetical protein